GFGGMFRSGLWPSCHRGQTATCCATRNAHSYEILRSEPVKVYEGANVRNVALVGHGHAGKTSLVAAALYTTGAAQRMGRVDDGTAPTDYDEEEIARKMSIGTGIAFAEWGKTKINLVDTPGFNMFVHEAKTVLPTVEAALVVVDGVAGVEVVTE